MSLWATRFSISADSRSSRRVQWRAPVIQDTGRLRLEDRLSSGVLGCCGLCRSGVRTKFGIDMVLLGEPGTTRSSKEGWTGPGRRRSRSKSPCRSVVGLLLWIDTAVQPERYSETQSFVCTVILWNLINSSNKWTQNKTHIDQIKWSSPVFIYYNKVLNCS